VAGSLLGVMGLIPGMPNMAFLLFAPLLRRRRLVLKRAPAAAIAAAAAGAARSPPTPSSASCRGMTCSRWILIGLEVGFRLVPLVDKNNGGELLSRIRGVRRKLSQELGFLVQSVHIRDNLELAPNAYRISLAGVAVADGVVYPDRELAINPGRVFGKPPGIETRDPAFGMEAIWIEPSASASTRRPWATPWSMPAPWSRRT
jgi:flagellar biosynthesis protein FlhA